MTTFPTVHINGTSRDELIKQLEAAAKALHDAQTAFVAAAPHSRDYYPQGPKAYYTARDEHDDQLVALQGVLDYVRSVWTSVNGQGDV